MWPYNSTTTDKMIAFSFYSATIIALLLSSALALEGEFSYSMQDQWPNICVTGNTMRQSPIDIMTADVQFDESLIPLEMTGFDIEYDGTFSNEGMNGYFTPDNSQATTRNHLGTYDFSRFHFHWGSQTGEGSEHQVDSDAGELEIHFVQRKQNETEMVGDYLGVIAVIADVDEDMELTGPWLQLNASRILVANESIPVVGFRIDQLLPTNRDYFTYEGSFTSPPCYEIVNWFVMKERITIPGAYLEQLRQFKCGSTSELLGPNFRLPQDIAGRVVRTNSQAAVVRPVLSLLVGLVLLILLL